MNPVALATGGWMAAAVGAVAKLNIAEQLSSGPKTVGELAAATGTNEYALKAVMNALVAVGLFGVADPCFVNTPDSEMLRDGHPASVRYRCILFSGDYQRVGTELLHTLRTGEPGGRAVHGGSLYAFLERNTDAAETYDRAMEELSRAAGSGLAQSGDFSDYSEADTIVDLGGGRGGLIRPLLAAHPHLHGVCFDREDTCQRARRTLAEDAPALVGRLEFVSGNFFESVPPGARLYLLKNVLHNWNDASCVAILRTIRTALAGRTGARLLIIEPLIESPMPPMYRAFDQLMQVAISEAGVVARSQSDYARLSEAAGLAVTGSRTLSSGHTAIEVGPDAS